MTENVRRLVKDALQLPVAEREQLVEKLFESLVALPDLQIEKAHLRTVAERRADYHAGRAELLEGKEALKQVRAAISA